MLNLKFQNSLQNSELGKYLDSHELEMLLTQNKIVTFSPHQTILQQGKYTDGIYIIIDGNVVATAKMLAEGVTNIEKYGPGNVLGEISFIEKVPLATSVIAKDQVDCLYIPRLYFELLSVYFPETGYKILIAITQQVCARLKRMHDKIIAIIGSSDMITRSFFGEMRQSLTKPEQITIEQSDVDMNKLLNTPLFKTFTPNEIQELLQHSTVLKAPKNCKLIHEGEKKPSCFIVIYGAVQSSIVQNNKIAKLSVIGPATLFASTSCADKNSSFTITFVTCEQAILFKMSEADLNYFQKEKLQLWYKLFNLICRSLVALERSIDKLDIRLNIETYNK